MKGLEVVRDLVVICGMILICYVLLDIRNLREHERAVRLIQTQQAIERLEAAYKAVVFDSSENKGIYQQIFRQNEIALEYQKVALLRDLTPTDAPPQPKAPSNIPPPPK